MEKSVEWIKKNGNKISWTHEKRRWRNDIQRLYLNGELQLETKDIDEFFKGRQKLFDKFGITDRDLGILPADPKEWTREERGSFIDGLCEL